jgi:shikimate kinase
MVRLAAERAPYYAEVADAVIDVDELSPDEVADRVIEAAHLDQGSSSPSSSNSTAPST